MWCCRWSMKSRPGVLKAVIRSVYGMCRGFLQHSYPSARQLDTLLRVSSWRAEGYNKRNAWVSVQIKSIERIPSRGQKVLLAVEQIRFRRIRDLPQTRVPEWFAERGIIGDQIARHIATEDEPARRSQSRRKE